VLLLPLLLIAIPTPAAPNPPANVARLIEDLGDSDIDVRQRAHLALEKLLPAAAGELRQNLRHPDAEVAARCEALLRDVDRREDDKNWAAAGKLALVDGLQGRIACDLRLRDGVQVGDRLRVTRLGVRVGLLVITDVQVWGSWLVPLPGYDLGFFRKGDVVQRRVTPK
jgi:hypothetical protein